MSTRAVPRGWPLVLVLAHLAGLAVVRCRPAATVRDVVGPRLAAALGTTVTAEHLRVAPGRYVQVTGGRIGTPDTPLGAGAAAGPVAPEALELRGVEVHLPGGIAFAAERGRLVRTRFGTRAILQGTAQGAGVRARDCRCEILDGGDTIRLVAGSVETAPRGVALHARDVDLRVRRAAPAAGPWRGTVTAARVLVSDVPGADARAEVTIEPSGAWTAVPLAGTLAGGQLRGHVAWRAGALQLGGTWSAFRLDAIPPSRLGAGEPVRGWCDGSFEATVRDGSVGGHCRVTGRAIALADVPALLALVRTLQFRPQRDLRFAEGELRAEFTDAGLLLQTLSLRGPALTLDLRGQGLVGWDGLCALPLRATAPRGLLGGMPVVGDVVGDVMRSLSPEAREPVTVDLDVGGSLDAPETERAGG